MAHFKYTLFGILAVLTLLGCSPPRYYSHDLTNRYFSLIPTWLLRTSGPKLNCFDPTSLSVYYWQDLKQEERTDLFMALIRVNRGFFGPHGDYPNLLSKPFTSWWHKDRGTGTPAEQALEQDFYQAMTSSNDADWDAQTAMAQAFGLGHIILESDEGFKLHPCKEVKKEYKDPNNWVGVFTQPMPDKSDKIQGSSSTTSTINNNINISPVDATQGSVSKSSKTYDLAPGLPLIQNFQLVVTAYLFSLSPADRLEKIHTIITPIDRGVEFVTAQAAAIVTPIKFGTQTDTGSLAITTSGIPIGGGPGSLAVNPSISRAIARDIKRQFTTQNVQINPLRSMLFVDEDGGPAEADVSGNKVYDVTISIPPNLCTPAVLVENVAKMENMDKPDKNSSQVSVTIQNSNGTLAQPKTEDNAARGNPKTKATENPTQDFKLSPYCIFKEVRALIASVGIARFVEVGQSTVEEDDDWIRYVPFKNASITNLYPPSTHDLGLKGSRQGKEDPIVFVSNEHFGEPQPLVFKDGAVVLNFNSKLLDALNAKAAGRLKPDADKLMADADKLKIDAGRSRLDVVELIADADKLKIDADKLKSGDDKLRLDVVELIADADKLKIDVEQLIIAGVPIEHFGLGSTLTQNPLAPLQLGALGKPSICTFGSTFKNAAHGIQERTDRCSVEPN